MPAFPGMTYEPDASLRLLRQREHIDRVVAAHRLDAAHETERAGSARLPVAGHHRDILLALGRIADGAGHDHAAEHLLPEDLSAVGIKGAEAPVEVAPEQEVARGHQRRPITRLGLRMNALNLASRENHFGDGRKRLRIGAGPHHRPARSPAFWI